LLNCIESERLVLEPLEERHAEVLFAGLCDTRIYQFIDDAPPPSINELRRRYGRLELRRSPDGSQAWLNWAIYSSADAKYVGYVQATIYDTGVANLGYVLFVEDWGKGYGTEAVRAVIDYLIDVYQTQRFTATVDKRNDRSRRLLEKLGFRAIRDATLESEAQDVAFERVVGGGPSTEPVLSEVEGLRSAQDDTWGE
jgi:RimJ/RimL family protein N-acetyltransferase